MNIVQSLSSENEVLGESRFSKIYQSEAWESLDPLDRAQLLLVAEGKKPGTIIGGDQTTFLAILDQFGLEHTYNTDKGILFPVYTIGKKEVLSGYFQKLLQLEDEIQGDAYHYINGSLLGYPKCCTDEYCRPSMNIVKRRLFSPNRFISNFTYESIENGGYPEEFNFCPPSFTPCSIYCKEAIKVLKAWKLILEKYDTTGAQVLSEFNKRANAEELASFDGNSIPGKIKGIISSGN